MRTLLAAITIVLAPVALCAQSPAAKVTYDEHVMPIMREKCAGCHNPDKKSGGLVVLTYGALLEGGSSGKVVEAGDLDKSSFYKTVAHLQEPFMPPKGDKLTPANLETIKKWIVGGLLENSGSKAKAASKPKFDLSLPVAARGKPEGPPPMPGDSLRLEPLVNTTRATAVTALTASPWAPLLAVGGQKQIVLYHSDTLEPLGILPFPEGVPQILKFSRNGSLLLAGGGKGAKAGRVVVFNVQTGERVMQVGEEFDSVLAADISADQSMIALGGPSKVVRIFSTKDGQLLNEIRKHTDWVTALEFSPDGVLLTTGDRNGGLFVWEAQGAKEWATLRGHSAAIVDVSYRADGNLVASASEDGTIRLWEMENGGQVKNWAAHGGGAQSVRFALDGRLVSTGRDRVTKVWDQNGAQQKAFEAFPDVGLRATFTHDGAKVIAGDWTGLLKVWTIADAKAVGTLSTNPPTLAQQLELTTKTLVQAKANYDKLAAAAQAAKTAADQTQAEVAASEKAVTDATAQTKASQDALAQAKALIDAKNKELAAISAAMPAKEALAKILAEVAAKSREAVNYAKDGKEVVELANKAQEVAAKAAQDVTGNQKLLADTQVAIKAATDQSAQLQKQAEQAAAAIEPLKKAVEAKKAATQAAATKAAADLAAANQALAAVAQAKKSVDKWSAAVATPAK